MGFKKALVARAPFVVGFSQQVAAGSLLTTIGLFANPAGAQSAGGGEYYEVLEIEASWDVISTSGTADFRNVPAATAFTGGASLINSGTVNLAATARAVQKVVLPTNRNTRLLIPGATLTMVLGGTLTNLAGFNVAIWLQSVRGLRSR